jgi:hypothetical protein
MGVFPRCKLRAESCWTCGEASCAGRLKAGGSLPFAAACSAEGFIIEVEDGSGLPYHAPKEKGFVSIGDWHSTTILADGLLPQDARFTRLKRACGLREASNIPRYRI